MASRADGELAVQAGDARVGEHDVGERPRADAGAIFDVEVAAGVGPESTCSDARRSASDVARSMLTVRARSSKSLMANAVYASDSERIEQLALDEVRLRRLFRRWLACGAVQARGGAATSACATRSDGGICARRSVAARAIGDVRGGVRGGGGAAPRRGAARRRRRRDRPQRRAPPRRRSARAAAASAPRRIDDGRRGAGDGHRVARGLVGDGRRREVAHQRRQLRRAEAERVHVRLERLRHRRAVAPALVGRERGRARARPRRAPAAPPRSASTAARSAAAALRPTPPARTPPRTAAARSASPTRARPPRRRRSPATPARAPAAPAPCSRGCPSATRCRRCVASSSALPMPKSASFDRAGARRRARWSR